MKKLILRAAVLGIILIAGGCAPATYRLGPLRYSTSPGIILSVTHLCTDEGILYQTGAGEIGRVVGARPHEFELLPIWHGGNRIEVTFQSLFDGKVLYTFEEDFRPRKNQGLTPESWVIGGERGDERCR